MTVKHTPSPWVVGALESGKAAVDGANGEEVTGWVEIQDAHLIAAAPDLLAACEAVTADANDPLFQAAGCLPSETYEAVIAAIAKAKGEKP